MPKILLISLFLSVISISGAQEEPTSAMESILASAYFSINSAARKSPQRTSSASTPRSNLALASER